VKEYFLKFDCPNFVDSEKVLRAIQEILVTYKCKMTQCGEFETLKEVIFRHSTGACKGRSVPPKYTKKVSDDFSVKG